MSSIVALAKVLQTSGDILMFNSSEVFLKKLVFAVVAYTQSFTTVLYIFHISESSTHLARLAHLDAHGTVCCQYKSYH